MRALVHRVAALLGVEEPFDVYLARAVTPQVEIEAGPPPALLVPANAAGAAAAGGAACSSAASSDTCAPGRTPAARIPRKDLGLLVAAGVRTVFPDYGARRRCPRTAQRRRAEDRARAAAPAPARVRAGGAVVPRRRRVRRRALARGLLAHRAPRGDPGRPATCWARSSSIARGDRRLAAAASLPPEELLQGRARQRRGGRDDQLRARRRAGRPRASSRRQLTGGYHSTRAASVSTRGCRETTWTFFRPSSWTTA